MDTCSSTSDMAPTPSCIFSALGCASSFETNLTRLNFSELHESECKSPPPDRRVSQRRRSLSRSDLSSLRGSSSTCHSCPPRWARSEVLAVGRI